MKAFISTVHELIRKDNFRTWGPMIGSFAGTFLSPALGLFLEKNPDMIFISTAAGLSFAVIYLLQVFLYVQRMHSIYAVLRSDESLWRTCAYLACLKDNTYINNYKLTMLNIQYKLGTPIRSSTGMLVYPFSVEYDVHGIATSSVSSIYYHTLGAVHKDKHISIEYAFDNNDYLVADDSNKCGSKKAVTFYKFMNDCHYQKGAPIHYRIKLSYDAERGIAVKGTQRLLFNPSNFSSNCKDAVAQLYLTSPDCLSRHFNTLHLNEYINGLNQVKNNDQLRLSKKSIGWDRYEYSSRILLDNNQLYALAFIARNN